MANALRSPRPPVCLRIGVTGHRVAPKLPPESVPAVRGAIDRVIADAASVAGATETDFRRRWPPKAVGTPAGPELIVVSSLAEGADRLVAEAGLAAGFSLQAVLPFPRVEYATDFDAPASQAEFAELLGRAASVLELDGLATRRPHAYHAAGRVMLANADLLVAVWDGEPAAGAGGTADVVSYAIASGLPVVWIDPADPAAPNFFAPAGRLGRLRPLDARELFQPLDAAAFAAAITALLVPPTPPVERSLWGPLFRSRPPLDLYLAEREKRLNFCPWFPLLQQVFGVRRLQWRDFFLPSALADTETQWHARYFGALPPDTALSPAIERLLLPAFSAADHLAVYYSLVYRSSYVFNFLFAALASALALFDLIGEFPAPHLAVAEFVVILAIVAVWAQGSRKEWHRRWLDYRRLAETLRHLRILAPLGAPGPAPRPGEAVELDEHDWVDWYVRALQRQLPVPNLTVGPAYLAALRDVVRTSEIAEQRDYHQRNGERARALEERMHLTGLVLFGLTAVLTLVLAVTDMAGGAASWLPHLLVGPAVLLPTLGAALGAIQVQGDFKTVAEQSLRTAERLAAIDAHLASETPELSRLTDRAEHACEIMTAELHQWRTAFRTRSLTRPG